MINYETTKIIKFSIVVPCFNEGKTLRKCIEKVLETADETLSLEIIIVDDGSSDQSLIIARELEEEYSEVKVLHHEKNQGKGPRYVLVFKKPLEIISLFRMLISNIILWI